MHLVVRTPFFRFFRILAIPAASSACNIRLLISTAEKGALRGQA
jgi:hypothetical protein